MSGKNARKCAMRMLDTDREQSVRVLQLYLTEREARELHKGLTELLKDPEKNEHVHVFAKDMSSELSFSIVTETKLQLGGYTSLEDRLFSES